MPISANVVEPGCKMARSFSYILPTYNGFSHEERVATNAIQREGVRNGQFKFPDTCSICGFSDLDRIKTSGYIFAHLEDYRLPLECLPCCKRCHAALHARFRDPDRWLSIAKQHWREGAWFGKLTMDPASQFRPFDETYRTIGFHRQVTVFRD